MDDQISHTIARTKDSRDPGFTGRDYNDKIEIVWESIDNLRVALYARVSTEEQREGHHRRNTTEPAGVQSLGSIRSDLSINKDLSDAWGI